MSKGGMPEFLTPLFAGEGGGTPDELKTDPPHWSDDGH
jgi:hypothetical protein